MPWPTCTSKHLKRYRLPSLTVVLYVYRYDGRGALADLRIHEPPSGGFDQRTILTEEELKVEQLCDEERYRSLYNNDAEESMNHEEEIKRLHQALDSESSYNQVGYNYNEDENGHKASGEESQSPKQSEGSQEEDQAFVAPPELEPFPEGMVLPETQKLNAIIMKTALFISQHGSQLEILIKTKQANNPQFAFLSIDEPLHQYYKYVLDAIKSGKYNPEKQPEKEESEPEEESDQDDEPYLHPSLASSLTKIEAAPSIPSIQYKPSADCAYSMLVNKITGKPPPSKVPQALDPTIQAMPSAGYYHPVPPQSYPPYPTPMQYSHGPVIYGSNGQMQSPSQLVMPTMLNDTATTQTVSSKETPTPLVPYGIPAQKPLSRPSFIVPPAEVQVIIDKMASYVAKNGRDFETIVKNKGDSRFNFLELSHQYHGYYAHKLTVYEGAINPKVLTEEQLLQKQEPQEEKQKKLEELQKKQQRMEEVQKRVRMIQAKKKNGGDTKVKQSTGSAKQITTVSFSIKKPKDGESPVIEKRNALPLEESDEEMESDKKDANSKPGSPEDSTADPNFSIAIGDKDPPKSEKKPKSDDKELVDLTDDILEDCQKEIRHKQAQEDRIKDKLAAAARDKLLSRERQLQLERKKRAAIFLSHIQTPALKTGSTTVNPNSRKDDSDEIHSLPSPSLEDNKDKSSQDTKMCGNSLMDRLKGADLSGKRSRQRSRSRSGSRTDRHKLHKKHKKKKSSHRSNYDSSSSSRSHRSKKSKKSSSRHRSRSRSPSHRHRHNSRRRESNTSHSDSSSP
ncbi:splicing factor, suppressor of white-apricot homolog isoform X2 [Temnothorax curvispinosus]|uniref:Splicing factor, suppressor of white-apricot homolog isoform X2 n=1 Tax=Temnothorax curvispinosus TaxID=300111 RepID=A0A6J1QUM1_9HYME|nr:splicing factor, suppressor of white-apricot homolog isoform X2 [Temnothorax curvispinosus]